MPTRHAQDAETETVAPPRPAGDTAGKWLGILVFLVGIFLLGLVFYLAYRDLVVAGPIASLAPQQGRQITDVAITVLLRAIFLFLMGYIASAMTSKGIAFYQAARGGVVE